MFLRHGGILRKAPFLSSTRFLLHFLLFSPRLFCFSLSWRNLICFIFSGRSKAEQALLQNRCLSFLSLTMNLSNYLPTINVIDEGDDELLFSFLSFPHLLANSRCFRRPSLCLDHRILTIPRVLLSVGEKLSLSPFFVVLSEPIRLSQRERERWPFLVLLQRKGEILHSLLCSCSDLFSGLKRRKKNSMF